MAEFAQVFEHTIAIPKKKGVTREKLWAAVTDYARHPENYVDAMEKSSVLSETKGERRVALKRRIDFGNFAFEDTVTLIHGEKMINTVPAMENCPASFFAITLENIEGLQLKFTYREVFTPGVTNNPQIMAIRSQAWKQKDEAFVQKILSQ